MDKRTKKVAAVLFSVSAALALSFGFNSAAGQEPSTFEEISQRITQTDGIEQYTQLSLQLLEAAEVSEDPLELLKAYKNLSAAYRIKDEAEEANRYAELGLALIEESGATAADKLFFLHEKARALNLMGFPEQAMEYADRAYEVANELESQEHVFQTTQTLANIHGMLGNHSRSLQAHLESLESLDLDDTPARLQALNNVILVLTRMGDLDRALEFSDQAEEVWRSRQNPPDGVANVIPTLLLNRANVLRQLERYDEQLGALEEADQLLRGKPYERTSRLVTGALADAYINLGNYRRAIQYARRALEGVDSEESPYPYAIAIANLGIALSKSDSHSQGLQYLQESRQILERIQARSEALELQGLVAEAYEESGNHEAALAEYRRFKELSDAFHRDQIESQLANAEAEFDVTLTQKEVDLLEAERRLQALTIGRQRLFALAAISGLLALSIILGLGWNRYRIKTKAFEALSIAHQKLDNALEEVKTLQGLLPICANCKNVRDDKGLWSQIESYISKHSDTQFSHTVCPDCFRELYPDYVESVDIDKGESQPSDT